MLTAVINGPDGGSVLLLGLSRENTRRLHADKPIPVRAHQIDPRLPELTVLLVGGETEQTIAADLRAAAARKGGDPAAAVGGDDYTAMPVTLQAGAEKYLLGYTVSHADLPALLRDAAERFETPGG